MYNKIAGMLGIATRARKTITGENVINAIQSKKAHIILISKDASENTIKKIADKCQHYHIAFEFIDDNLLNSAIGSFNKKVVAITDEGMSKKIMQYMKG